VSIKGFRVIEQPPLPQETPNITPTFAFVTNKINNENQPPKLKRVKVENK
jgi:hypothetical protein